MRWILVMALLVLISACATPEKSDMTAGADKDDQSVGRRTFQEPALGDQPQAAEPSAAPRKETTSHSSPSRKSKPLKAPHTAATTEAPPSATPERDDSPVETREARVTPLDQSEAEDDVETTRKIRQALMRDEALSFRAKNVTVVTNMGHVTLRGPVKTREEADRIKEIARSITGRDIEDRLQISE